MSDAEADKRTVAERLGDAGLATDRFINVHEGGKASTDHDTRHSDPRDVPGENYGIYPGGGLVDVDIDDYSEDADNDGLAAILALSETLTVETPHTDGETGGHRYYHVTTDRSVDGFDADAVLATVAERTADAVRGDPVALALAEAFGTPNPQPSWGEVRAVNQYVVGPGSQLDGCDKDGCDDCATLDGGQYRVANDVPIATVTAEAFVDALRADPDLATDDRADADDADAPPRENVDASDYDPTGTALDDVITAESKLATYVAAGAKAAGFEANGGGDDRSDADYFAASLAVEYGVPEREVRDKLADCPHSKAGASDAPRDYWRRTWSKAVANTDANSKAPSGESDDGREQPTDPYEAAKAEHQATTDAGRAYAAWTVLGEKIDVLAAQPGGTIYACRDGVWRDDGKQLLRERAHGLMGTEYSKNVLEEIVEQVRATNPIPIDDMGTPPRMVAVANGLLDLETRDLRDLRPEDRALAQLPVEYDPDAECPEWRQFIGESVEPDRIDAIQEYVGYCLLTGELPFARVLLLVGGGSNGKTSFLNVVTELLGPENTTGYSLGDLVHSEYYVAQMHGAIANIDADVTGGIGHGGMFKKLTGGDRKVSARKPYGEPFDYHPTTKQLYAANEVPDTKVDDDAFFRRWLIVEFPTEFTDPDLPGPDKDPGLEDRLQGELSSILNWALDGLDRLLTQEHFTNEGTTDDKRERWRNWGDSVERFISECVTAEGGEKHRTGDVYDAYTAWCAQHGETAESQQTLTAAIKKLDGVQYSRAFRFDGKQERGFKGLALTAEAPPPTAGDGDPEQSTLPQDTAVRRVHDVVAELAEGSDNGAVPVEDVVDTLDGELGDRDPHHLIENALARGEFYEPQEGWLCPT